MGDSTTRLTEISRPDAVHNLRKSSPTISGRTGWPLRQIKVTERGLHGAGWTAGRPLAAGQMDSQRPSAGFSTLRDRNPKTLASGLGLVVDTNPSDAPSGLSWMASKGPFRFFMGLTTGGGAGCSKRACMGVKTLLTPLQPKRCTVVGSKKCASGVIQVHAQT